MLLKEPFSGEFKKGKKYLLRWPSGTGKSTLVKCLMGLYIDFDGLIRVDGHLMRGEPLKGLFAYVPQNNEVFEGSLFDNIALGRRISTDYVGVLEISGLIKSRDDLDLRSKLGEEGIKLSGGEIQRLGLCRALVSKAAILVLDECTANLDTKAENQLYETLIREYSGTLIIISHSESEELSRCELVGLTSEKGKKS